MKDAKAGAKGDYTSKMRARELLARMSPDEKIGQVVSDMILDVGEDYEARRNPLLGSYRNPGHFMHQGRETPASPAEVAERINRDVELSVAAQPHGIPPIENGEALHGAQWGMCTNFPQPIGLASSFDPELVGRVAGAIGRECDAVGVRQVFAPVVNLARDCRWGRTVETFGEDVKLSSDMGAAMTMGLQRSGVIATPKHFADNYAFGGRDSNYSETGERTMRETILPPFKACVDAGAQSVMAAYNGWDAMPCTANHRLLTDILRNEWGFDGFVVSDYCGVDGLRTHHCVARTQADAVAMALNAGLDVILPFDNTAAVREALDKGLLSEEQLDRSVLRVLEAKFRLGLFDDPSRDPAAADAVVRCGAHRELALEAARESIVLLKNDGVLPLAKSKTRRVGVFGCGAKLVPIGTNYSGPYKAPWRGDDAPTPLEALKAHLGDAAEVAFYGSAETESAAPGCDAVLYFTSIVEGENLDRSDLRLPHSGTVSVREDGAAGFVVDEASCEVEGNQEEAILRLCAANPRTVVVLQNGAPVDMAAWIGKAAAVVESWYPGEQGAKALAEILFGATNPSAKLPISIPRSVGQLPLPYCHKPTGRGYGYCDDDGRPLFPFGFGLSYTTFEISGAAAEVGDDGVSVTFEICNTGPCDGTEVVQLYVGSRYCKTARPVKELKAYGRFFVESGGIRTGTLFLPTDALSYHDSEMVFGLHDGLHELMLGTSSDDIAASFEVEVKNGALAKLSD